MSFDDYGDEWDIYRAETYMFHELMSHSDYFSGESIHHWRSASGFEVDFIIGDHTAIEVKAKQNVSLNDLRSLSALAEERKLKRYVCVSLENRARKVGNITVLPYLEFLQMLWSGRVPINFHSILRYADFLNIVIF